MAEVKNDEYLSYIDGMTEDDILPGVSKVLNYLKTKKCPSLWVLPVKMQGPF